MSTIVESSTQSPPGSRMRPRPPIQSVDRALEVIEVLADAGEELGVSELAARTGLPLATAHRVLDALCARGYVRQNPSRRYSLGGTLIRLGAAAERLMGATARPFLAQLVEMTGETANLAVSEGDAVVYIAQVPSSRALRTFIEVGRRARPHSCGVGKMILALWDPAEAEALLRRTGLPASTAETITDMDEMLAELARVRELGYAEDRGEQEDGVRCIAVPVMGEGGVVAAMSVSGPAERLRNFDAAELAARMRSVADELGAALYGNAGGRRRVFPGR